VNNGTTQVSEKTTAIVVREPQRAIEPANMSELRTLAEAAAKTGFFGAKTPEGALLVMMAGRDLGLSYSQALRAFHVIQDDKGNPPKLVMSADGMVAVCLHHSEVCEYFRVIESTEERAVVETKRVGNPARRETFTIEEARRANLVGKFNWRSYPAKMLLARAKTFLARSEYADLLLGLYDPDEVEREPAPLAREELRGEVVPSPQNPTAPATPAAMAENVVAALRAEADRIGRDGTLEEAEAWVASVSRSGLTQAQRKPLTSVRDAMKAAIHARAPAPSQVDEGSSDPDPETGEVR
jgi:hypothetical protein